MRMRLLLLAYCGAAAMVTVCELRSDDKNIEKHSMNFRQISVRGTLSGFGLSPIRENDRERAVFGEGQGAQWDFRPKGDKWVIAARRKKTVFLSAVKDKLKDSSDDVVILKDEADETGLWEVEFEGNFKNPTERSDIVCTAKATSGAFRGCYLTVGNTAFEKSINGTNHKLWPASLSKLKSDKSRLRIWVDGK